MNGPLRLDSDKDLPPLQPVATEGPEDAEDEEALGEGALRTGEEAVAESGLAADQKYYGV